MKNLDSFDFDCRPVIRRSLGGCRDRFVCRGDLGSSEGNASSTNQQVSLQGGAEGSNTIGLGANSSHNNITIQSADPAVIDATLVPALNFATGAVGQIESAAANEQQTSNNTIQYLGGTLAALTANATPQTGAAQSEILAGTSPLAATAGTTAGGFSFVDFLTVAVSALGIYVFFKSKGKAT